MSRSIPWLILMSCIWHFPALACTDNGLQVEILVNGTLLKEYPYGGVRYIEALQGREYVIRLSNHLDTRAAVALSVDGLNTIDAQHTTAYGAKKWVLEPYQSIDISGWQISGRRARSFYFTAEENSYAQKLGQRSNLGIISVVLFKEKALFREVTSGLPVETSRSEIGSSPHALRDADSAGASPSPSASEARARSSAKLPAVKETYQEYAATGIGRQFKHEVNQIDMDLEPVPAATINFRYEFRTELVRLGVLPYTALRNTLERRQQAKGFDDSGFCPSPR